MTSHHKILLSFYLNFESLLFDSKLHYTEFHANSNIVQRLLSSVFP